MCSFYGSRLEPKRALFLENKNMEKIINKNQEFLQKLEDDSALKKRINELANGQHPKTIVITCSDSRVIPEYIMDATFGELFVIRTAGNVINDGELATLEYGIAHLKISDIIVLGHTSCGAIHAAIHNESGKYVGKILDIIKDNIEEEKDELEASKLNALKTASYIRNKFSDYSLNVIPAIYDIKTGVISIIK